MNFKNPNDTIVALATGDAVSAISLIRVSGKESISICDKAFSKNIAKAKGNSIHFGEIKNKQGVIDECLLFIFRGPKSFTGEDTVEITCHGSVFIRQEIVKLLLDLGARLAEPGEYSMRAFLNKKMDLSETEAIADLIYSENKQQHNLAMHQMKGGFKKELSSLRQRLIDFASLIELELDFSGEDVEFANREDFIQLLRELDQKISKLIDSFQLGNVIKNGVFTVIAGRPNAGKSTLLNALLNEERAIVSDIPGTTRDVIEDSLNIGGVKFRLFDTAGIREANDQIESIGIKKTFESIEKGSILIYVFSSDELSQEEVQSDLIEIGFTPEKTILLANKSDKKLCNFPLNNLLNISAIQGEGIEALKSKMTELSQVGTLSAGDLVVSNVRHLDALKKTKEALDEVQIGVERSISGDLLAIDIRRALFHLGEITGEVSSDDLLGNIFANFCIGK